MAKAGPELLLHETLCASPSFETETVPPVQVIDASVSPEAQVRAGRLLDRGIRYDQFYASAEWRATPITGWTT
jgi:hypothetical protein